jgi:hypothetical protein
MPLFVLNCVDKPNALEVRMGAREAHLAYVSERIGQVKLGGPLLDDNGDMAGSLLILDVPDRAAAEAFTANDPYAKAGLFQRVEITPFRASIGQL